MCKVLMFFWLSSLSFLFITSCNHLVKEKTEALPSSEYSAIRIEAFPVDTLGWGYDIYKGDVLYIHQPQIPAIGGVRSFRSKDDAVKTAALVVKKIRNGIHPPSLSLDDLMAIGVVGNK